MKVVIDLPDLNFDKYKEVPTEVLKKVTLEAEANCKKEAPVDTGTLRASHSSIIEPKRGTIVNSTNYWQYVVFGTQGDIEPKDGHKALHWTDGGKDIFTKRVPKREANNYPQRALTTTESKLEAIMNAVLREMGLD